MTLLWVLAGWCIASVLLAVGVGRVLHEVAGDDFEHFDPQAEIPRSGSGRCPVAGSAGALPDAAGDLHRMLCTLEQHEPRLAKTVLLCWIGGLSPRAAAEALGVPAALASHDLQIAKHLLRCQPAAEPRG